MEPVGWCTGGVVFTAVTTGASENCQTVAVETGDSGTAAVGRNPVALRTFAEAVCFDIQTVKLRGISHIPAGDVVSRYLLVIIRLVLGNRGLTSEGEYSTYQERSYMQCRASQISVHKQV